MNKAVGCGILAAMDETPLLRLRRTVREWRRAVEREEAARHAMQDAIADALDTPGIRPIEVTAEAPYSREHVRRAAAESRARRVPVDSRPLPTVDQYDALLKRKPE